MAARRRLNVQGLARRAPELMTHIVPDEGHTTVSIDLAAGEPTVTSHFSQDKNYRYACFDGVGKAPFYKDGVLMIDDIYLMYMSTSPIGAETLRSAFKYRSFDGLSFQDQWLKDPEVIKKFFKSERNLHKMLALALGYGMGWKKMVKQCYDQGITLEARLAKGAHRSYWELYSGVREFADRLALQVERKGFIVNPFGYRLTPPPFKAFNYFIQSSVSGIMHVFVAKLMAIAPYAHFVTVIHDEVIVDVPTECLHDFRIHVELATASLNFDLKWSVNIRTGFAPGKSWYEAK